MADDEKGQRWPSTAELDLQARLDASQDESARLSELQGGAGQVSEVSDRYATEDTDTSGYVGVSPEYMTYADDRQKPFAAEGGALAEVEEKAKQATPVRDVSVKDNNQTEGGGTSHESVYSATSGEDFTPEKVDNPGTPDGGTVTGGATPVATQTTTAPPARKAAPAKETAAKTGDNS